ncbi:MAG: hypothetical protein PHR45_05780 [Muribaculaceae bacterium]|nr:hypothetical protein [Muribaculaceae bacterium]
MITLINLISFLFVILLFCAIIIKNKSHYRELRNILSIVAIGGGFMVYFIAYVDRSEPFFYSSLHAAMSTARSLILLPDYEMIKDYYDNTYMLVAFAITHIAALLLVISITLSLFGTRLVNLMRILFGRADKNYYLFFDDNTASITLANDIKEKDKKSVIVFMINNCYLDLLQRLKGTLLSDAIIIARESPYKAYREKLIRRVLVKNKTTLYFLSNVEYDNIKRVDLTIKRITDIGLNALDLNIYIRLHSDMLYPVVIERYTTLDDNIKLYIFDDASIVAKDLIMKYPPVSSPGMKFDHNGCAETDYEVAIIGFGNYGNAILRNVIEYGQFVGSHFKAHIIDENIDNLIGSFTALNPAISDSYDISGQYSYAIGSSKFYRLIETIGGSVKQIFIALQSDEDTIKTAMNINSLLKQRGDSKIQIFAAIKDEDAISNISVNNLNDIILIGQEYSIFSYENLADKKLHQQAFMINNSYNKSKGQQYQRMSYHIRLSNIATATHIFTKLKLMGLDEAKVKDLGEAGYKSFIKGNPTLRTNLAVTEHLRWNAFHFVRGWQTLSIESSKELGNVRKDEQKKLHSCLVDWNGLPKVEECFNDKFREYDYDNIDNLYNFVIKKEE